MTEEEKLAEEYASKVEPFMDVGTDNSISVYHEEDVKQAFLAGYKAKTDEINKIGLALQSDMDKTIEQNIKLEAQIEKLIDFVLSRTDCCDVCPITDTCINSEGTCPYAGILVKGEEEVTREWLMQFISRR